MNNRALSFVAITLSAVVGSVGAALLAAALEARSVSTATGTDWHRLVLPLWGLLAPLAVVLGVLVGVARCLFVPGDLTSRVGSALSAPRSDTGAAQAFGLGLGPLAAALWLVVVARWALFALSAGVSAGSVGAALALGAAALGAVLALSVQAGARVLGDHFPAPPAPVVCLLLGCALGGGVLTFAIATGATSGAGGPLSQFGVLRRDELDVRPLGWLSMVFAGAVLVPRLAVRAAVAASVAVVTVALGATLYAGRSGLDDPAAALAIERSAPLGARLLAGARRLSDRDRDGSSAAFAGGDCDESSAGRHPAATDIPGNGIDEDCSGSDARATPTAAPAAPAPADARGAALAGIPEALSTVLITIDTLRHDLGYMGYPRPITPNIDQLARESVVFERAYALASYTAKSLPPMLIGKYAGETHRGYSHFNRFGREDTFVSERLQRAGLRTISVQGHWYFFQKFGMERGFDVVNSDAAPKAAQVEGDRTSTSDKLTDAALRELARPELQGERFFLWVHYTDPHAEYVPHQGFTFGTDSRALYDGEVAFVDHHVGRLLTALRASPAWSRTAVVLTSDHGEAFGEHGMIRHGFELWEELVRVPLLVRVPGLGAHRVSARRSTIDLVPTLLELMRVPAPKGEGADFVSGRSLLEDLMGPAEQASPPRPIFVDMSEGPHNAERRAFIAGDMKLVTSAGRPVGLFDLAADPGEKRDLSRDRERVRAALEAFSAFRQNLREVKVRREP